MGSKLGKSEVPSGHSREDFECFGPPALKDGEFGNTKIADLGCFTQDGKDSNKYYHACVAKSKKTGKFFAYFEWGRTGATKPDFQFVECDDENDAQSEYESQLHSKNDKRGQWVKIAGIDTLQAKAGKDCYLVRPMATRSTGLPDAKTIKVNDGSKKADSVASTKKSSAKKTPSADSETLALMRDLNVATVAYTRGAMADSSLPTQGSIDDARSILAESMKRIAKVGDDVDDQVNDKDLNNYTKLLYSRIPKRKPVGAAASTWILSKDNIAMWQADLDAFESALASGNVEEPEADPFDGMKIQMSYITPTSELGKWILNWAPNATRNQHYGINKMHIKNMWKIERHGDKDQLRTAQADYKVSGVKEKALFQDRRPDLGDDEKHYTSSNTALLFHGTRSVNVSGILRKSLLLPKQLVGVVITGAMFGPGLYFADDWKKSAGYTSMSGSYWSGGDGNVRGRKAFMFLTDVVLGNPYVAPGPSGYTKAPNGHHCVFGKAGRSQVQNNEWIVYETRQHMLRYLIEFDTK